MCAPNALARAGWEPGMNYGLRVEGAHRMTGAEQIDALDGKVVGL